MKAIHFDKELRCIDLPVPSAAGDEALIRLLKAGICNTDLESSEDISDSMGSWATNSSASSRLQETLPSWERGWWKKLMRLVDAANIA